MRLLKLSLILVLSCVALSRSAQATGYQVVNTNDSGSGSLRLMVATAPSGEVIDFAPSLSGQTIRLTSGELNVTNSISITAAGLPDGIIISGNNSCRIMTVTNSSTAVTLSNLTLVNGNGFSSVATSGQGAAILNQGLMRLIGCTICSNNAGFGAIRQQVSGTMWMTNCTLSGNNSTNEAGAYFGATGSSVTMIHCTISSNNATTKGGGVRLAGGLGFFTNTIISGNTVAGNLTASEANLAGFGITNGNNLVVTNPSLAVLGYYGGPTPTMPPLAGSFAIDGGTDSFLSVLPTDQRGSNRLSGVHADIGSVEYELVTPPVIATLSATAVSNSTARLRASVNSVSANTPVSFEWGLSPFTNTNTTPSTPSGAALVTVTVTNILSGFTPGLIYYYRAIGSNTATVVQGKNVSFGTPVVVLNNSASLTNECHAAFTDPFTNPVTVSGAPLTISSGGSHGLALRTDGTVAAWGNNISGRTNVPAGLSNVVAIAGGGSHSLALKNSGTVVAWGNNTSTQTNVPTSLSNVVAVAAGYNHSVALKNDGTVSVWGDNSNSLTVTVPSGLTNVAAIAAGQYDTMALTSNGTVVAWGYNVYGETNVPSGLSNVIAIAAGAYHNLALKSDGTVTAWGAGTTVGSSPHYGQSIVPSGLTNVAAIAAGQYHSLALQSNGTVVAWGYNLLGQTNVPAGLNDGVAIAAGDAHSLVLRGNGTITGWGLNGDGQTTAPWTVTNLTLGVTSGGTFNTNNSPGSYLLTYFVTNSLGGIGSASRTVVIQDKTAPVITVAGNNPFTNSQNVSYIDPGATALDSCGGSTAVASNNPVNVAIPGTYTVTYTASDVYGNSVTNTRSVVVVAPSTIWTVNTTNDSGAGSLRQAVSSSVPGDVIQFTNSLSGSRITLTSGEIAVNKTLTIDASSLPGGLQINGNASSRIFNVTSGSLLLSGLTITNGRAGGGGGVNSSATLIMERCTVVGNVAPAAGGGGIQSSGTAAKLVLRNCTVASNTASFGGGILSRLTNSSMSIIHSTISTNVGTNGTGGLVLELGSYGTLENMILAGNVHPGNTNDADLGGSGGTLTLVGNNIIGVRNSYSSVTPVGSPNTNGNYVGTSASPLNPFLATLGNFGGPTQTMPPLPGSPAINACTNGTSLLVDQRGYPRIVSSYADIGAVEGVFSPNVSLLSSNGVTLSFQFPFTNLSGRSFSILSSTNVASPLNTWSNVGTAIEIPSGSGQFQFTDPQATTDPTRFYGVKAQ